MGIGVCSLLVTSACGCPLSQLAKGCGRMWKSFLPVGLVSLSTTQTEDIILLYDAVLCNVDL